MIMLLLIQDTLKYLPEVIGADDSTFYSQNLFILVQKLGIAVLIGMLIGLEREHSKQEDEKIFAGIRTFPLISILGFIAALVSSLTNTWVYFGIFFGYALLITVAHYSAAKEGAFGGTSEMANLLVFILGSLVFWNFIILAAIISVVVTLFLSLKFQLHKFVGKIGEEDIYATIKLAIITVIILPLLPDKTYGPLNVLNPRMIWYMVIFISGISFVGYIFIKIFEKNKGIPLTGLMGGMVSSTAVAFSFSKKSKENEEISNDFAVGLILASSIMYPRVFLVVLVINNQLIENLWIPLLIFTFTGLIVSYIFSKKFVSNRQGEFEIKNPFELKSALLFGIIFGIVIFAAKAAEYYLGNEGIYVASSLGGFSSVDAIVLSLANLAKNNLNNQIASNAIVIALIANTIVKGIVTLIFGSKKMQRYTIMGLSITTVVSLLYLFIFMI